eukprot:TRINITY_DN39781_c0_g1_i1.p1 TRINITY_DN39781_c0_g1~~TRINITY_DN39781_c0_g1_i1.p1  ORF type:complete len:344 (+),score=58.47 TRINITY_DN39781_c0_g1_i1:248-1279(+)
MLGREALAKLFPTPSSLVVFVAYMGMFVAQGMLVTASRNGSSSYSYNTVTVVLITEMVKLVFSSIVYLKDASVRSLFEGVYKFRWVLLLYLVPATLYCLYNNLSFLSLAYFDPTTYFMFMQIRLLLTGLIYQILFKKTLSSKQWFSLALLTVGCMVHAGGTSSEAADGKDGTTNLMQLFMGCMFVLIQVLCSVFAGVYNEYLIKGEGADIHIMIQNVFMYLDSILCSVILLGVKGDLASAFSSSSLASINQNLVLILILNNSILGIITSLFLKKLNSILKAFASALELVFTALLSVPILGIPLNLHTVLALCLISVAVVMYAQNPVQSQNSNLEKKENPPSKV